MFQEEEFAKELRVVERLKAIAKRHDKSVAQMAIAWTLGNPAVSVGLVGVRNEWELKENVAAADWKLSADVREEVDAIFAEESRTHTRQHRPGNLGVVAQTGANGQWRGAQAASAYPNDSTAAILCLDSSMRLRTTRASRWAVSR